MLKQYYSVGQHYCEGRWVGQNRNTSRAETRHKLLANKSSIINERVQKIRNKYSSPANLKQNFISNQSVCLPYYQHDNKQNESTLLNLSGIEHQQELRKHPTKDPKPRKPKKTTRQSERIHELEEINMKISKLIETLRCEQNNQSNKQERSQLWQPPTNYPTIRQKNKYLLSSTKISLEESRKSRVKTESLDCSHKSNRSSSSRENGKITKMTSVGKSAKDLNHRAHNQIVQLEYQQDKLVKELCKQVQYDQMYMKEKTMLMKVSKKCKQLLDQAVNNSLLQDEEKQLILEWNFQDADPLYTERNTPMSAHSVNENELVYSTISCFLKCQDHWKRKILKKFNQKDLNLKDLDIQQKGYFLKEDLTRFISLKSKKMLCNRDINLIFRRINRKKSKIVPMQEITKTFCQ